MTNNIYCLVNNCMKDDSRILFWSRSFYEAHRALQDSNSDHLAVVPVSLA